MSYYLRTLEGVEIHSNIYQSFIDAIRKRRLEYGQDEYTAIYDELDKVRTLYGDEFVKKIIEKLRIEHGYDEKYLNAAIERIEGEIEQDEIFEKIRLQRIAEKQEKEEARAISEAEQIINRGETMIEAKVNDIVNTDSEVEIEPVIVDSLPEYSIIDEDETSITYEDEAGGVHTIPKAKTSAAPWLLAAAAAVFFLA